MFPAQDLGSINLFANVVMLAGCGIGLYVIFQQRRMLRRLETVIAPKVGIEAYLSMCAQVVEADPDGTCVVSDSGEIVMVNEGMENISGYHRSELVGQQVEMLVPDAMRGGHAHHRDSFTMRPSSRPMRGLLLRHKRGMDLPVDIRLNRYTDVTGGFTIAKVRVPQV
jgi:PAS domain S-box-containing protein